MADTRRHHRTDKGAGSAHVTNVAENLQLLADLGYADVAVAVVTDEGSLEVVADARPMTAATTAAATRTGDVLAEEGEPEAFEALASGRVVKGIRRRITRGISYVTHAYPIGTGDDGPYAVLVRDIALQVLEAPGTMETQFMQAAEDLLGVLARTPLQTTGDEPFATTRRAGDGVLRLDDEGRVAYASPNVVNIMRLAGVDGRVTGMVATRLPGGSGVLGPVLQERAGRAIARELETGGRFLNYRAVRLERGALVMVEDRTDARRKEQELKVKEATIREVHHRVKNNLQTIASLLRIQARRTSSDEAKSALAEAVERVSSMAVVHDMLASSADEKVDFTAAARTVVDLVSRGLLDKDQDISVSVEGSAGEVSDQVATSLALVIAELVHNAIEHGLAGAEHGEVVVTMRRFPGEFMLTVRDDGHGLPADFDPGAAGNLGLAIVRTIVADDLKGALSFGSMRGTTVTVRIPMADARDDAREE